MKKRIAVVGLMVCIICGAALTDAAAAGKRINNYVLIKYLLKRSNIDFDVITFERADGIYKGMVISGPDGIPVTVAMNQSASQKKSILFSVAGEDNIATISENGDMIFTNADGNKPTVFICIFQSILDVLDAVEACEQGDTRCVLRTLLSFAEKVISCVGA